MLKFIRYDMDNRRHSDMLRLKSFTVVIKGIHLNPNIKLENKTKAVLKDKRLLMSSLMFGS